MKAIAVDDERHALNSLERAVRSAIPEIELAIFSAPSKALEHAQAEAVDVAFLDVEMGGMSGLELAKALKDIRGRTNIIFVTGYSQYAVDAFSVAASGYLLKPVEEQAVRLEIERLRYPVAQKSARIRIRAFGNFDVFDGDEPVLFRRVMSKEILAYLVDRRGASVTKKELAGILWEDAPYTRSKQVYLQILVKEMLTALEAAGAADIIIKKHNSLSVDMSKVDCDYYSFLNWDPAGVNAYHGEYMANYGWARFTQDILTRKSELHYARGPEA